MKDRIRQIMEAQHMSQQTFANFIGMSAASLSSIFNNRTKPTLNTVEAIKNKIPNINIEWLMFGHGSMFKDKNADMENNSNGSDVAVDTHDAGAMYDSSDLFGGNQKPEESKPSYIKPSNVTRTEVKYIEKPQRKITEIHVYFDDLTYETFVPKK